MVTPLACGTNFQKFVSENRTTLNKLENDSKRKKERKNRKINKPQLHSAYMDFAKLSKERLKEILVDPVLFSEHVINMPCVSENEEKFLRSKAKRKLIKAGRRWGKTTMFAIDDLHDIAVLFPELQKKKPYVNEIIMFGPSWEQCEIYMDAVRDVYNAIHPFWKPFFKITTNQVHQVVINGIKIIALSATKNSRAIRGHGRNVGKVNRDEDAYIPDELMKIIRPVRISNSAKENVGSTTAGHNHFFKDYNSDVYESYSVTSYDNKFIDKKDLDEERKLLTEAEFNQEYMAEFMDDRYSVFPQVLIDAATNFNDSFKEKPEEGIEYVMGVDFGKRRDATVLIIGHKEDNHIYVDVAKEIKYPLDGLFWTNTLREIENYIKLFKPTSAYVDQTGMGDKPTEDLRNIILKQNIMTFIKGVDFTRRVKNGKQGLVNSLLLKFERKEIHFPFCEKLIRQLKNIRFESSDSPDKASGTYGRYTHIGHDDYVMAFTLMVSALPDSEDQIFHTISNSRDGETSGQSFKMGQQRECPGMIVTNKQEGGMRRW